MASDPKQVQAVFLAAVEKSIPSERAVVLDRECGSNADLRRRVEALLHAHDQPESLPNAAGALIGETISPPALYHPGAVIAGRYKLLEQIGEGGMGAVWVAEQTEPVRRRVALKLIKPGMDTKQVLSRFAAERQALALMDHPNIAKVFDGGMTEEGRPYFVMEYVKGVPITEYCDQARLSIEERLKLFLPVCQAVQHAHQKGIIHRDLKPSNVLVCPYDGQPIPKVIDFGLAKAISQPLTEHTLYTAHGVMVGTPLYMSPEQAEFNNLDVDTRTDIYSLGVILYELLTGATPLEKQKFKDAAFAEILRLIKEEEPPKPSTKLSGSATLPAIAAQRGVEPAQLNRLVRGELDWIVMKCLEKDRGRRYETSSGLARDVERYLHDELVEARPPSATYKLRKFVRRHRVAVFLSLFVAASILAIFFNAIVGQYQVRRERDRALAAEQQAIGERNRAEAERVRSVAAEQAATTEKTNVQAALEFLENELLSQASPEQEPDRDLKLRTALDRAAKRLDDGLERSPLVEASLRQIVGRTYNDLGELPAARRHLERALEIRRRKLGPEHHDTVVTAVTLAIMPPAKGGRDQHEQALTQAVETSRHVLGDEHPFTLNAMTRLAYVLSQTPRQSEKRQRATQMFAQILEINRRVHGDRHPETLKSQIYLALDYGFRKQFDQTVPIVSSAYQLLRKDLGEDHPTTIFAEGALAYLYQWQGNYAESEALDVRALETRRRVMGVHHPMTGVITGRLALTYEKQGKLDQAVSLLTERLAVLRNLEANSLRLVAPISALGRILLKQKKYEEAEPLLREACKLAEPLPGFPFRFANQINLGASLAGQGKYEEAEEHLLSGYQGFKERESKLSLLSTEVTRQDHRQTLADRDDYLTEALQRIIDLYSAWNKPAEAAQWREVLRKHKTAGLPDAAP